jgi:hypothetical protein
MMNNEERLNKILEFTKLSRELYLSNIEAVDEDLATETLLSILKICSLKDKNGQRIIEFGGIINAEKIEFNLFINSKTKLSSYNRKKLIDCMNIIFNIK